MKLKNKILRSISVAAFLILQANIATSQLQFPPTDRLNVANFQQNLDVFDWLYKFGWAGTRNRLDYALGLNITSSMLEQPGGNKWKDNQNGFWVLQRRLSRKATLLARMQHTIFHDELSSFNYDRRLSAITFANAWKMNAKVELQPELGFRWEKRAELLETGPYTALLFSAPSFPINNYQSSLYTWGEITRFSNRRNSNARLKYAVWREFNPGTSDSLAIYYDFLRRDNYFSNPLLGRIESLRKAQKGLENFMKYQMSSRAALNLRTVLSSANVTVKRLEKQKTTARRSHDNFNFENQMQFSWRGPRFMGVLEFEVGESTVNYDIPDSAGFSPFSRRFATLGYDIEERKTRLTQRLMYNASFRDSLRFYFELTKLQHDNSDARNPDSYDEQKWQISLLHRHRFSRYLTLNWEFNIFLKHFVYLDASLSSQNNWTRLLQFQPSVRIQLKSGLFFQQNVGIRTQYVDFDFDARSPITNSYVIRDLYLADSLVAQVNAKINLSMNYRYEMEELGSLNWRAFSSLPRTLWKNQWLNLLFNQQIQPGIRYSAGVVFYQQSRFQYHNIPQGELTLVREGAHVNLGPTLQFSYQTANGSTIFFSGQRQKVFPFRGDEYFVNHFQLLVQWTF